jgi:5'-phosphate synthase pdxT subunit
MPPLKIGVLALQGAFAEHQALLESLTIASLPDGISTVQVKTPEALEGLDGIVLPGGESTAMGLIGKADGGKMWLALQEFVNVLKKPTWGTCAGMILLADKCVGASATIEGGQSLIGGMDVLVCRNYFGSQISSFEMATPAPPTTAGNADTSDFNGVFIRAPAILSAGPGIDVLGEVVAVPCMQAAATLKELDGRLERGEDVCMQVVDENWYKKEGAEDGADKVEEKKSNKKRKIGSGTATTVSPLTLPSASTSSNARSIICCVRKENILCSAFHPELTDDDRWHRYFVEAVVLGDKK